MKAPGFPTQVGEEPGAFRVRAYGEVRAHGRRVEAGRWLGRHSSLRMRSEPHPARLRLISAHGMSEELPHPQVKTR